MGREVVGTLLTGAGILVGAWRMMESVRRDLGSRIDAAHDRIDCVNTRTGNILLADRSPK